MRRPTSCASLVGLIGACHATERNPVDVGPIHDSSIEEADTDTDADSDTDSDSDADSGLDTDDSGSSTAVFDPPAYCARDQLLPAPLAYTTFHGFTNAEDFTFDDDGNHVALDEQNHLYAQRITGTGTIIATNVATSGAGTVHLTDGSFVINDAGQNTMVRVYPDGAKQTILSGLSAPNGLEVGPDDFVYVAEAGAGRVRRVDPDTGAYSILAVNVPNANGIAFGPGYTRLYVGAFGGGRITAIPRRDDFDSWGPPFEFANVGYIPTESPCTGLSVHDACIAPGGGAGVCTAEGSYLSCRFVPDSAACADAVAGDACATSLVGAPIASHCVAVTDMLYCPRVSSERMAACEGLTVNRSCDLGSESGQCKLQYEGVLSCLTNDEGSAVTSACTGATAGERCTATVSTGPYGGTCEDLDGSFLGVDGFGCSPPWLADPGNAGLLDGLNVDECGDVYATDYGTTDVYRIFPDGTGEVAVEDMPSNWIPNAKWAPANGGWNDQTLYVADREYSALFAIDTGLRGKQVTTVQ
jgi:sugar lactone lactonase YvrE